MGVKQAQGHFELNIDGVSHAFGRRRVLSSVSAIACTGQVMVITGPNGSGKSTLMKIAARLVRPTSGRVIWRADGRDLGIDATRTTVGMVSPDLTLYDELTAMENLRFFARARGSAGGSEAPGGPDHAASALALLDELGLAGRGDDLVGAYSSGMKQRLKYAFALLHRPGLLLLDEPTANLDEHGRAIVRGLVERARAGACIVIATNEPEEVHWGDFVVKLGV